MFEVEGCLQWETQQGWGIKQCTGRPRACNHILKREDQFHEEFWVAKTGNKFERLSTYMKELQEHVKMLHESYLNLKTISSSAAYDGQEQYVLKDKRWVRTRETGTAWPRWRVLWTSFFTRKVYDELIKCTENYKMVQCEAQHGYGFVICHDACDVFIHRSAFASRGAEQVCRSLHKGKTAISRATSQSAWLNLMEDHSRDIRAAPNIVDAIGSWDLVVSSQGPTCFTNRAFTKPLWQRIPQRWAAPDQRPPCWDIRQQQGVSLTLLVPRDIKGRHRFFYGLIFRRLKDKAKGLQTMLCCGDLSPGLGGSKDICLPLLTCLLANC